MSIEATTWALWVPVGKTKKVVLLGLSNHADPFGENAWPSVETLAAYAHCDPRTVQRALRELEEEGWIGATGEGPRGTVTYRLSVEREVPRPGSFRGGGENAPGVTKPASKGVTPTPPKPSNGNRPPTTESARAAASEVPEDFPDELRPHAKQVMRVLRDVARSRGAKQVTARGVARTIMARPRRPLVRAAYDCAAWIEDHPERQCKDVLARYRRWLDNEPDLAGVERLDESGMPCQPGPSGVVGGARPSGNAEIIRRLTAAGAGST